MLEPSSTPAARLAASGSPCPTPPRRAPAEPLQFIAGLRSVARQLRQPGSKPPRPLVVLLERQPQWHSRARGPAISPRGWFEACLQPGPLPLHLASLANPSLEARPSEAVRLARVSKSVIIAHPGKAACLCGPAQLKR
jgi:hypothetical protein